MKSLIFIAAILLCGSAQAQCENGQCQQQANWQPLASVVNVLDAGVERSVGVVQTSACVASHVTAHAVTRPVAVLKRIRKHSRSRLCGR